MAQQLFSNNATGALNLSTVPGSLAIGATAVTLVAGKGSLFPTPSAGDYFLATLYEVNGSGQEINHEIVKVTNRTADTLTIVRAQDNTSARSFPDVVGNNPSGIVYCALRYTAYAAGNTLNKDDNLASLGSASTARTNLGLGTIATQNANSVSITGGTLTGATYNGLTPTAAATGWTLAGGTTSKTLTLSNTLTLAGTDGSTLNIETGGTLGTAAYTASTAYEPAITTLAASKGGTGVANNAANTITFSGNYGLTLTLSNTTSVTLPTSGTLMTLGGTESVTGAKTFDSSAIKMKGSSTGVTTFASANAGASNYTITFPAVTDTAAVIGTAQTFSVSQRGTVTTDNDLSFDLNATNNFKCTPTAGGTLTFTNIASATGQSGYVLLVNGSNYTISAHANTKVGSSTLASISATGTYLLSYFCDGTNVYVTSSGALA